MKTITIAQHGLGRVRFCSALVLMQKARPEAGLFLLASIKKAEDIPMIQPSIDNRCADDSQSLKERLEVKTKPPKRRVAATGMESRYRSNGRRRVVSRLWKTAEKQVAEVELRLAAARQDPQALERDAKTLAIIARTIRDLVALDAETHATRSAGASDGNPDGDTPRDIESFRATLAQRLDQLRLEGAGDTAS